MGPNIVIVEDEPNIAESLSFILTRASFNVTCVPDGNDAIFEIQNIRPKVVILDVMLPNRSGLEILRDIRGSASISKIPVLMLSAKGQARDKEIALEAGADRYVVKPFSNSEVLAIVHDLTGAIPDNG